MYKLPLAVHAVSRPGVFESWRRVVLLVTMLVAGMGLPAAASAHPALKRSAPKAGAALDTIPRALHLEFNEGVELRLTRIVLTASDGRSIALDALSFSGDSKSEVVATPRSPLVPGQYRVQWQAAGSDGHPTRGSFEFTIRPNAVTASKPTPPPEAPAAATGTLSSGATGASASPSSSDEPEPPAEFFGERSPTYVAIRWLQYLAVFLVVGALIFTRVVLRPMMQAPLTTAAPAAATRNRAVRIGLAAAIALVAVQVARLAAQRATLQGGGVFEMEVSLRDLLFGPLWGTGFVLVLLGSLMSVWGYWRLRTTDGAAKWTVPVAVVLVAIGLGLSGHQAASRFGVVLAVGLDAIHVLAAAAWLGTLAVLVAAVLPIGATLDVVDHAFVAETLRGFSPVAMVAAGIAGAAGLVLAAANLGAVPALWRSDYGRTLLAKLAVLSIVAGTGAYNWRRVLPRLGTIEATRSLRRSATVEVSVAIAVIVATALLVATPTPPMP